MNSIEENLAEYLSGDIDLNFDDIPNKRFFYANGSIEFPKNKNNVYVLLDGYVKVYIIDRCGQEIVIDISTKKDILNLENFLLKRRMSVYYECLCECFILELVDIMNEHKLEKSLVIENVIVKKYMDRLYSRFFSLSRASLAERIAFVLLELDAIINSSNNSIPKCINQTLISKMGRGSRGIVNKILNKWEREGWICLKSDGMRIIKHQKLKDILEYAE